MGNRDTLRLPRAAARIEDVRQRGAVDGRQGLHSRRVGRLFGQIEERNGAQGNRGPRRLPLVQDEIEGGVFRDERQAILGVVGRERDEGRARLQNREHRQRERRRPF